MSPAAKILYGIIRAAVETQAKTPIMLDMKVALAEAGIFMNRPQIAQIIRDLDRDDLIVARRYEKSGNIRYGLPGSPLMTAYRSYLPHSMRVARQSQVDGWPRVTAESRTAYDAALKLGPPIRIVGRPDHLRPMPRVTSVHVETRSLTGSAAEMCAV